jgi:uncharacterized membrane protein YcaP (DUF421 family)
LEQAIQIFDWKRMFFGDEPPLFLLEVVLRTAIVYVYALALLRWLGSRTIGQLSTIEFLLVIALGSAVGDAMFYPDVPLLHALLVITLVVVANKCLDVLIAKSKRAETAIDGIPEEAVRDGVLCTAFLDSNSLSSSELFQQLREKGIEQLGEVAYAFVETDGVVSVFHSRPARPGLQIAPPWEIEPPPSIGDAKHLERGKSAACMRCGTVVEGPAELVRCSHCNHDAWAAARC